MRSTPSRTPAALSRGSRSPSWLWLCWLVLLVSVGSLAQAAPPAPPVITEPPVDGHVASPADVHMETLPMSDPDPGDTHFCTDWEIWTVTPAERVWITACIMGAERVHTHLGDGVFENSHAGRIELFAETEYKLRVRHRDNTGSWSPFSERFFMTAALSDVFPLEIDDVADTPIPRWLDGTDAELFLPGGPMPGSLEVTSGSDALLLRLEGVDGTENAVTNPGSLPSHVAVRVVFRGGTASLASPSSRLLLTDGSGRDLVLYLPSLDLAPGADAYLWISSNGSSYWGDAGQTEPDFSILAEGAPVPWNVHQNGYKIEVFATGFQLPVHLAFVPVPGPELDDPFFYVTELYGNIKLVTRDGSVSDYASGLLNFDPGGNFPGSGEQGVSGICVDPVSGDVFASMLYDAAPPNGPHYPKVVRFHSVDGGYTASSQTTILNMVGESQGQSHFISNLSIGPDGKLYVHMGDGFDASKALNLDSYRGKILRANLNGTAPSDNPFYNAGNGINARDYVYAYGFRNPFGGDWRLSEARLYEVENGPDTNDRLAGVDRGASYGWNGTAGSMTVRAIYNWNPPHAPVDLAFIQAPVFGGSGFPAEKLEHAFVTESGPTWATGPQAQGKRVVEFELAPGGELVAGPNTLVEYSGSGKASASGIATGPDGLYFADLYKDQGYQSPIDAGANILRIKFVGTADFAADFRRGGPPLTVGFTDLSNVPTPSAWLWTFGDGESSSAQHPSHEYTESGIYDVRLEVTGSSGVAIAQKNAYVIVGDHSVGLRGDYYAGREFDSQLLSRIDPVVDFQWGDGSPDPRVPSDNFSARWTGRILPEFSESYTIYVIVDDGVRLWIDEQLIIDRWIDQPPTEHSATVALEAGAFSGIRMEYYENGGGATARLEWSSPSQPREVIPTDRLYPNDTTPAPEPSAASAHRMLEVRGNPLVADARVYFFSASGERVRLGLFDVSGRLVRDLFDETGAAGAWHSVTIDPSDIASGTYFLRLVDGGGSVSRRIVVVR